MTQWIIYKEPKMPHLPPNEKSVKAHPVPVSIHVNLQCGPKSNPELHSAIQAIAVKSGLSEFKVGEICSRFWEEVANCVIQGGFFRIPGFGAFGTKSRWRGDMVVKSYPAFSAVHCFRREVYFSVRPSDVNMMDNRIVDHSRRHTVVDRKVTTVKKVQQGLRQRMRGQVKKLGLLVQIGDD
jgi:hypothetical protein